MGIAYVYNEAKDCYYVGNNKSLNASVVKIFGKYDDGTHGEKNVTYITTGAFEGNTAITKVILPDSVKSLDGGVFQGCSNLEYVSMTGVENLDYNGSASGYGTDRGNNFMNCTALKYVILSPAFTTNCQQFFLHGSNPEKAILDIYVNAASGTPNFGGANTNLLTGNVYYKVDDTATVKCMQWKYGADGEIVKGASSHTFVDGKCSGCGKVQTEGLLYALDEEQDCYYVSGYNGSDKEIYVLSEYNGKPVTYIKNSAFFENTDITKVILPTSIKRLDGGVFQGCGNLEYVSMLGIEEMLFAQIDVPYSDAKVTTNNNFIGCTKLTVLIVGEKFNLHPSGESYEQQFLSQGNPACIDVYVYGTSVVNCSNGSDDKNGLLTGNVYYYSETESENSWRYVDGVATKW